MMQWEKAFEARTDATYQLATFLPAKRLENQAHLDVLVGNFVSAEKNARESMLLRASSSMLVDHSVPMVELAHIMVESGQTRQAGKLAQDYLGRSAAWEPPGKGIDFVRPQMLEFARMNNTLTLQAFAEQREMWGYGTHRTSRNRALRVAIPFGMWVMPTSSMMQHRHTRRSNDYPIMNNRPGLPPGRRILLPPDAPICSRERWMNRFRGSNEQPSIAARFRIRYFT